MVANITFRKDLQYYKFCLYGFLKNQRFFEPFIMLFFLEKGLTFLQIGTLIAIREITTNILEIPTGFIADAMGRRRTMVYSFVSYILSFVIYYAVGSFGWLVVAGVFFSFGDAFRTGTHKAMIFEYLTINNWNKYKVHYYGHTRSWSQVGSAISSLIAAGLVLFTGFYRTIFIFSTIPYFLDLMLMLTYPKYLDGDIQKIKLNQLKQSFGKVIKEFLYAVRNKSVLKAVTNLSIHSGYYDILKTYIQPVIQTYSLVIPIFIAFSVKQRTALLIGIIFFVVYLLTAIGSRNSGKIADKFGNLSTPLNLSLIAGFICGITAGAFYSYALFSVSVACLILLLINENIRRPMGISAVSERLPSNIMASALSFESQSSTVVAALLAPLAGYLADSLGIGYALVIVSGLLLVASPLYLLRRK